jgi:DHA2 family multidrug resistance protein
MMFLPLSLVTLGGLPKEDLGAASGLYNLSRQLGGSFGIAALTVVLDQRLSLHRDHLLEHLQRTDPRLQEHLQGLQQHVCVNQSLALVAEQVQQQASLLAFGDVFRSVACLFMLALPLLVLMPGPQPSPQSRSRLA